MNPIPMKGNEENDKYVIAALKALAAIDRAHEARPEIGASLRTEFRARKVRRMQRIAVWWTLAAAAIVAAFFAIRPNESRMAPTTAQTEPSLRQDALTQDGPERLASALPEQKPVAETRNAHDVSVAPHRVVPVIVARGATNEKVSPLADTPDTGAEEVTEFFPLMSPAPPFDRGELLRVNLPGSALQMIGLPVREERLAQPVQADVLIGEEGMPRAIRFVRADFR